MNFPIRGSLWARTGITGLALVLVTAPVMSAAQDAALSTAGEAQPSALTLEQAIAEAEANSPAIAATKAEVEVARGKARQAGLRVNPELSVEVENFAGTGAYSGLNGVETTVSVTQQLDLGGKRSARKSTARAELDAAEIRLSIARADTRQAVTIQFAQVRAAEARLELARGALARAVELERVAVELVNAGREPPLAASRAKAVRARADASLRAAEAEAESARNSLGALLGRSGPAGAIGPAVIPTKQEEYFPEKTLDVKLAEAEVAVAEAGLTEQRVARRLDPSVGIGVRRVEETGDQALVASVSFPLPIFDRNQGNVYSGSAAVDAARARVDIADTTARARIRNAVATLEAARARVKALKDVALPQAEDAARLADLSYRAGKSSLTELLDAQETLADVQSDLIDAELALAETEAVLARAAAQ